MRGTRKRTGPNPKTNNLVATDEASENDDNSGGPQSKKQKQLRDGSKAVSDSSPLPVTASPQTDQKKKVADTGSDLISADPSTEPETKPIKPVDKSPGKRGRRRKSEKIETVSTESTAAKSASESSSTTGGVESASQSTGKLAEQTSSVFSPRRSSRGVVPNRRFQDMELDLGAIGRKRSKEDSTGSPKQKDPKTSVKREQARKGSKSSGQSGAVKVINTTDVETRTADTVTSTSTATTVQNKLVSHPSSVASQPSPAIQKSAVVSLPVRTTSSAQKTATLKTASQPLLTSTAISPQKSPVLQAKSSQKVSMLSVSSSQQNTKSVISSSQDSSTSNVSSLQVVDSTTLKPSSVTLSSGLSSSVMVSKEIPKESETSLDQLASAASSSSSSQGLQTMLVSAAASQSLVQSLSTTTATASFMNSVNRTVSITSSRALLAQAGSISTDVSEKNILPLQNLPGPAGDCCQDSVEVIPSSETDPQSEVVESDIPVFTNLTEASVVEVSVVHGQQGGRSPRVVNISPSPSIVSERGKTVMETPGRVVGKPETSLTSKSVYIVRNPPIQNMSSVDGSSKTKSVLLPPTSAGIPSSKITTITKEAGVGDVMSIVEVSPNKKVPVVLAERKEHAGKVVKVISAQQISQLSPALQKIVSSHFQQQSPSKDGLSQSSELSAQQSQRTVTVHVATPTQSLSELGIPDSNEDLPGKSSMLTVESTSQETNDVPADEQHSENDTVSVPHSASSAESQYFSIQSVENLNNPATPATAVRTESGEKDSSPGTSGVSETQTQVSGLAKKAFEALFSDKDEDSDESDEDEEEEEGIPVDGKYVTSGTQTPYTKTATRKVITVHVHPPSKEGEKNREVVTVTKVDKDSFSDDTVESDERELARREVPSEEKGKYIFVDLPEGTTVKQQYVRSGERIDSDPSFYTVDEKGLFTCHICQYQTYRRPNFYKHKKKHLGLRPYACDQCPYRAATSSNLKRHLEVHKDIRNHKCPICSLHFRQKIHLERHIKYRHEEKKVKCPLCDYVCANENPDLKVHIKRRHIPQLGSQESVNAFKCSECGVIANSKRDLRQHLKFHSKGPELKLFCNMCSFVTDCESRLRRHKYIHTKEKPFQCGLCDYRGSQKEHVLRHMRTQHNIEIARKHRMKKLNPEKASEKEGSKNLEKADYTSEEKIFFCNHCEMKFSKLINLYKHLHTQHRDIMPAEQDDFSCVVCDFRTSNKKNLLVHMRRHNVTDQPPPSHVYSCVLCRYMNPKRRNLFQHMRKKHHIEIVIRDDGSTSCHVANDTISAPSSSGIGSAHPLSPQPSAHGTESVVNVLPLSDLISTVTQPSDLQVAGDSGTISVSSGTVPTNIKMEDLALVVSNPQSSQGSSREGEATLVDPGAVETFTIGTFSQDDAAEAIQGLQALAQRGVLEAGAIVEEQVQVMGSDDQTTLVIDPGLGVVEQLVQPKTEPLQVVEIENNQLLDQVTPTTIIPEQEAVLLGDSAAGMTTVQDGSEEGSGLQLSAEQLMNLSTGDYLLEINGERFKVEVSTDGSQGQQIISFEPAATQQEDMQGSLEQPEISLENTELS